tara:strand:+ start:1169 stop:1447 length:279 start_codon:yes stop_codon:yes gene_type:complete
MKRVDIQNHINEHYPEMDEDILLADGFEKAFLGIANSYCSAPRACYDADKCIEILEKRDGMSHEEAIEFFNFNVSSAYVGEFTPAFMKLAHS